MDFRICCRFIPIRNRLLPRRRIMPALVSKRHSVAPLSAAQVQPDEFLRRYWLRLVTAAAHHLRLQRSPIWMFPPVLKDGFRDFLLRDRPAFPSAISRFIHLTEKALHFDLQERAMRRREILVLQLVDLRVQQWAQFLRVDVRGRAHARKIATPPHPRQVRTRAVRRVRAAQMSPSKGGVEPFDKLRTTASRVELDRSDARNRVPLTASRRSQSRQPDHPSRRQEPRSS